MGLVNLPYSLVDGTNAYGSEVKANDDAIVAQVNGNLDNANVKAGANIDAAKLLAQSITPTQLATSAVTTVKIAPDAVDNTKLADSCINAEQLNNEGAGEEGLGTPRNELYTGSGNDGTSGYPPTNVNANRKEQSGKTVWAYFNIPTTGTDYIIDASMDWRRRMIYGMWVVFSKLTGDAKKTLPGGSQDDSIGVRLFSEAGGTETLDGTMQHFFFYSEAGSNGATAPRLLIKNNISGGTDDDVYIWVDSATGRLMMKGNAIASGFSMDVMAMIVCSPYLGT